MRTRMKNACYYSVVVRKTKCRTENGKTYTNVCIVGAVRYSRLSSFKKSVISVPRPRVLPRGSGNVSKELSSAEELNTYCDG
jgi:hypothetical protein